MESNNSVGKEEIENEAANRYNTLFDKSSAVWNANELLQHCVNSFVAGGMFVLDSQPLPQSSVGVEEKMKEIYDDKVAYWFNGQIGAADIRESVYEAMTEFSSLQNSELRNENEEKDRKIEDFKHAIESFELMAKDFKTQLEYWKQRCEAAEGVIEVERTRASAERLGDRSGIESAYGKWQQLKQSPIN